MTRAKVYEYSVQMIITGRVSAVPDLNLCV
jgi:hypothetical protein